MPPHPAGCRSSIRRPPRRPFHHGVARSCARRTVVRSGSRGGPTTIFRLPPPPGKGIRRRHPRMTLCTSITSGCPGSMPNVVRMGIKTRPKLLQLRLARSGEPKRQDHSQRRRLDDRGQHDARQNSAGHDEPWPSIRCAHLRFDRSRPALRRIDRADGNHHGRPLMPTGIPSRRRLPCRPRPSHERRAWCRRGTSASSRDFRRYPRRRCPVRCNTVERVRGSNSRFQQGTRS
jgi:hypothetical protein